MQDASQVTLVTVVCFVEPECAGAQTWDKTF